MEPDSGSGAFTVAFVCTGNRFRSVIAEATFRSAAEGLPVRTVSYGTLELGPAEPLPAAVREAHALGLDISTHVARSLKYAFTIEDPATWARPWTGEYTWPITGERMFEYASGSHRGRANGLLLISAV